jgi:hypothetical protein
VRSTLTGAFLLLACLPAGATAQVVLEEESDFGPALARMGDNVFLSWTGRGGKINVRRSADGIDWR